MSMVALMIMPVAFRSHSTSVRVYFYYDIFILFIECSFVWMNWVLGVSRRLLRCRPVLVWLFWWTVEELRAQRPSQVLPTQAFFTGFCAILTARTPHIAWVCAITLELGLFVFTLNIFFDTGSYLYYLWLTSSSLSPANPFITAIDSTSQEHTVMSYQLAINPIFAE